MVKLRAGTIQQWFTDFVDALQETDIDGGATAALIVEPALWPLRSAGSGTYH